jgi:hypothetical protein
MPVVALKVKINAPAGTLPPSRGFYQLEEETLYLPIAYPDKQNRFFSFLESETVSLQFDRQGRLILIEVNLPRRRWTAKDDLIFPESATAADIRFLDFRQSFNRPTIFCDNPHQKILIRFSRDLSSHNYFLAEGLIAQVSADNRLVALWASDIIDDFAGREIAEWRKAVYQKGRRPIIAPD